MPSTLEDFGKGKNKELEQNSGAEFVNRKILELFANK